MTALDDKITQSSISHPQQSPTVQSATTAASSPGSALPSATPSSVCPFSPNSASTEDAVASHATSPLTLCLLDERTIARSFIELAGLSAAHEAIVQRSVRLLRACGTPVEDVCVVFAYASAYFCDLNKQCKRMGLYESGYISVLLVCLAHSYVQDQTCPLGTWHKYIFKDYCTMPVLNKAIMSLLRMRGYVLRIDDGEFAKRHLRMRSWTNPDLLEQHAKENVHSDSGPEPVQAT